MIQTSPLNERPSNGVSGGRSLLARYFAKIRNFPVLTREQEGELGRQAREGRAEALERLIESNLKFVVKIAGEYRNLGLAYEDLINEGNLGLIDAAQRFDPDRGVKFISWAVWWIRKSIRTALSDQTYVVRLPISQFKRMRVVRDTEKRLTDDLGREPTHEEMSAKLPKNLAEVDPIHRHGIRIASLDEPPSSDQRETLAETMKDETLVSIEHRMLEREQKANVSALYERLNDQQRTVIACRFGLDGEEPQTLSEIGRRIGRSREGVRLIEGKAIERLRTLFAEPGNDFDHAA